MSTRQYIGARYVPKFYVNAVDGSSLWQDNVIYEPLTWVTRPNFRMYISRQTVPATIGAPEDNIDYWLEVGQFNGYITDLQSQINDMNDSTVSGSLQNQIDTVNSALDVVENDVAAIKSCDIHSLWHGKKVCIYGDSLSDLSGDVYWEYLSERDPSIEFTNRAVGGETIANCITRIDAATDLSTFDIIVIAYGTNEWQSSWGYDYIKGRFKAAFDTLKEKIASNPSIQVVVITPFYSYRNFGGVGTECNHAGLTIDMVNDAIAEVANKYGYPVLNFFHSSSCNSSNYTERLADSGGIYVHEQGAFSEELSYIVERWDGQSYIARKYNCGKNACSPIEFALSTVRLTQSDYNTIHASFRDGVCMKVSGATGGSWAFNKYLSADVPYMVRFWADNITAVSIRDSSNNTVWSQTCNANTEFKAIINLEVGAYYKLKINTSSDVSETIIGGLYFGRTDGLEIQEMWHSANVSGGTGTVSYKYEGDTFSFSSSSITNMTSGVVITIDEMNNIPSAYFPIMGSSAANPTMTTAILENNTLTIANSGVGAVYIPDVELRLKCYSF